MLTNVELAGIWSGMVDPEGPTELPPAARSMIGEKFDARVPGAIHADLQEARIIPDPFVDQNEDLVAWVGRTDWKLERQLPQLPDAERVDLVFDGIDTVSTIVLNGREIGRTRNMHRGYRFDIAAATNDGDAPDALAVHFTSAYTEAEHWERTLGERPNAYPQPFNFIRKMACSFGWDWGPTLVSAGLWRDVRIEAWNTARIASVRPVVDVVEGAGVLTAHVSVERSMPGMDRRLAIDVSVGGQSVRAEIEPGSTEATVVVTVPDVDRWHPRGYGDPHLYPVEVELLADGERLDSRSVSVGFRTIAVERDADALGSPFVFRVNGVPLFAKGVNWIPDSIYPGTMTAERYRLRLGQAVDANVNMVRVWGGGIYENDAFYDACDELGLLVWQDFLFACASYPEDEPFRSEVVAEATENVTRLSSHPSLALWCGNNENLWMHGDKHWVSQPGGELSWGENFYLKTLPDIVAALDPTRPYTEGSPWSGSWDHDPNDANHQTFHSWDVWNSDDFSHYRDTAPRFVSEFGWQGAGAWRTLRDAVTDSEIEIESSAMLHHQKAIDGPAKLARNLARHFAPARDFDEWHFQTQWTQVEAVRTGVLHWRANWPRTAGAIVWQLNDLWPVTSWSAIDGAGRLKPLYFALRDMYRDRVVTLEPTDDGLDFCAVNDTDSVWRGEVHFQRMRHDGTMLTRLYVPLSVPPRSVGRVTTPEGVRELGDASDELVFAQFAGERAFWYPRVPRDSTVTAEFPAIAIQPVAGGLDITVGATTLTRDILVQPDRIHGSAVVDRGFTTLLPGESALFRVRAEVPLTVGMADADFVVASLGAVVA